MDMDSKKIKKFLGEKEVERPQPENTKVESGVLKKFRNGLKQLLKGEFDEMELEKEDSAKAARLSSLPREWRKDRSKVLAEVEKDGWSLRFVSKKLRDDNEVVMIAVSQHGLALQWASKRLQNDPETVLAAVNQCGVALKFASKELRATWDIALTAVKQDGRAYWYIDDTELACDREIIDISKNNFKPRKKERL